MAFNSVRIGRDQDFPRALAYAQTREARASVPAILTLLKAKDIRVRRRAGTILIRLGLADNQIARVMVPALIDLLQDKDQRINTFAFDSLASVAPSLAEAGLRSRAAKR